MSVLASRVPHLWALWKMARPAQLLLILVVYALGVAIALGQFVGLDRPAVLVGALALLPTAMSVHYANEYADVETDALTTRTRFSGGSGALSTTGLPASLAWRATLATGAIAAPLALALWAAGALPTVSLGLLAAIAVLGWGYSLPPLAFSRRGLGEVVNSLVGGLLLPVYGASVLGANLPFAALAVVPFTLLVFANLLATQWPDRHADEATGKDTLVVRWPTRRLRWLNAVVVVAAYGSLVVVGRFYPLLLLVVSFLVFPLSVLGVVNFTRTESPTYPVLAMVGMAVIQLGGWLVVSTSV